MATMSRAQRLLLIYLLWELHKPRVIQEIKKYYGAGGLSTEDADSRYVNVSGDTMTGNLLATDGLYDLGVVGAAWKNIRATGNIISETGNITALLGSIIVGLNVQAPNIIPSSKLEPLDDAVVHFGASNKRYIDGYFSTSIYTPTIFVNTVAEKTAAAGVTVDGVLCKDYVVDALGYKVNSVDGVDGSFTTVDGKTVTASKGIITSIV